MEGPEWRLHFKSLPSYFLCFWQLTSLCSFLFTTILPQFLMPVVSHPVSPTPAIFFLSFSSYSTFYFPIRSCLNHLALYALITCVICGLLYRSANSLFIPFLLFTSTSFIPPYICIQIFLSSDFLLYILNLAALGIYLGSNLPIFITGCSTSFNLSFFYFHPIFFQSAVWV